MNKSLFRQYISKKGLAEGNINNTFRALDIRHQHSLSFREVLLGLAALEPSTAHGGTPAEMRCRYIFRYYDSDSDGLIEFEEFRALVGDIRRMKNMLVDQKLVDEDTAKSARWVTHAGHGTGWLSQTSSRCCQLKFRGTSVLFRLPSPLVGSRTPQSPTDEEFVSRTSKKQRLDQSSAFQIYDGPTGLVKSPSASSKGRFHGDGPLVLVTSSLPSRGWVVRCGCVFVQETVSEWVSE
ncbi:hypothetical protein NP493_568g01000 [Ridgeia piscesae]|uniref:EF-hand domain-containing protein n=1 Tax=Ridgeia piscesae TaxID=27915 RepID=A0AAD9KVA3_RIDPI|nr:hypothetical protein NP493_568g01000 [Ridgeia piscesae]